MKRFVFCSLLVALLLCPLFLFGQDAATDALGRMRQAVKDFGGYTATFTIASGEEQLLGSFAVEGERYRIELADIEVYGEATERYEVNKTRREVTILKTDTQSTDILSNPAHALELVGKEYRAVQLTETVEETTLSLAIDSSLRNAVRLTIDKRTNLPRKIVYLADGLELKIEIHTIKKLSASLPKYDPSQYAGYELIDFR